MGLGGTLLYVLICTSMIRLGPLLEEEEENKEDSTSLIDILVSQFTRMKQMCQ